MTNCYHFIPADNIKYLDSIKVLGSNAYVLDLEDSVSEGNKNQARENLKNLSTLNSNIYIRINSADSHDFHKDLACLKELQFSFNIVLSKCKSRQEINQVIANFNKDIKVIPLIEDFDSLNNINEIFAHPNVTEAGLGSEDLLSGIPYNNETLEPLVSSIKVDFIKKALSFNVCPIDTISTNFHNEELFRQESLKAKSFGYTAKFSIHPNQISWILKYFSPTEEELNWAHSILEAESQIKSGYKVNELGILTTPPKIIKANKIIKYGK